MSAWDFIGGFSDATLDTIKQREAAATDINKLKALEALRRETSDYEYARNKKDEEGKVDAKQSYYDAATNEYVMVNSSGKEFNRRPATKAERQADKAGDLGIQKLESDIANVSIDNARADRALDLQAQGLSEARAYRRERSLDGGKDSKLYSLAQNVIKDVAGLGLDPNALARVQSDLYTGITTGKYDENDIRRYQATFMTKAYESNLTGKYASAYEESKAKAAAVEAARKKALGL